MEILLLEDTHDIFLWTTLAFTYCLFYLTFFAVFDAVDSPQPIPPTTPHKYPILHLLDIFVFLASLSTNLV